MTRLARFSRLAGLAPLLLAACSSGADAPALVELPGADFYPESVTATATGQLLVGSFGTGAIAAVAPAAPFIAASADVPRALGVLADGDDLWLCADDTAATNARPPQLRRYDVATGALRASYGFPAPAFCNDIAVVGDTVFVTDSLGAVYQLAGDALVAWTRDPLIAPAAPGGFGANGIAWDGGRNVYVTGFDQNRIVRFAIQADGSAGPGALVDVSPALAGPDALRALDASTLLVVEQAGGKLTQISLADGRATPLATGLAAPTSVAVHDGVAWVAEGQLGHILGTADGPPTLPFALRRVELPHGK